MVLQETEPIADWSRVATVYNQCVDAIADPSLYLPGELSAFMAELLSRLSVPYFDKEQLFVADAHLNLDPHKTPNELYFDKRYEPLAAFRPVEASAGRRRPTPFESIVETSRRLRDVGAVSSKLEPVSTGGILGGSLSYGRFYNVIGQREFGKGSDIDFYLVVESIDDIAQLLKSVQEVPGVSSLAVQATNTRLDEFRKFCEVESETPAVFSCKIPMWEEGSDSILQGIQVSQAYHMSLHIMSRDTSNLLLLVEHPKVTKERLSSELVVADFRETPANRADHQRSFAGRNARFEIESTTFMSSHVRKTRAFYIDNADNFYPGMFQNLVLPAFDVRWSKPAFKREVESFRWKMVERLRFERNSRPDELLRLSLAHTRCEVFSPHVVRALNASTHLS